MKVFFFSMETLEYCNFKAKKKLLSKISVEHTHLNAGAQKKTVFGPGSGQYKQTMCAV